MYFTCYTKVKLKLKCKLKGNGILDRTMRLKTDVRPDEAKDNVFRFR